MNKTTTIRINPTGGKYSKEDARKTFTGLIDSDIENWGCSHDDGPTKEMNVECKKIENDGTFVDIFGNDPACFTKAQVMEIVKSHSDAMNKDGVGNFFPYMNGKGKRSVLYVYRYASKWERRVYRLEDAYVWIASHGHVVFLPQQKTYSALEIDALALEPLDPSAVADETIIEILKSRGYSITRTF